MSYLLNILTAIVLLAGIAEAFAQGAPLQLQPKKPATSAPAKPAPARAAPADQAAIIAKANEFLNSAVVLSADFVQIGADGHRTEGRLSVQKPGRMRFEYNSPATLEIIADGTSVAVRDRKLGTQDLYFIGQTPLKFLLKDQIDISRDTKVLEASSEGNSMSVLIEDRATFGGTSRIKLTFDAASSALRQWKVIDPQGYETLVSLFGVDTSRKPDPALFKINQENFRTNTNK
ncbi:MAG: outer-membrane lipoprotein carrier protein LolA [Beijerinckiaceae bacterium]